MINGYRCMLTAILIFITSAQALSQKPCGCRTQFVSQTGMSRKLSDQESKWLSEVSGESSGVTLLITLKSGEIVKGKLTCATFDCFEIVTPNGNKNFLY